MSMKTCWIFNIFMVTVRKSLPFNIAENYPEVFYVGLKDVVI